MFLACYERVPHRMRPPPMLLVKIEEVSLTHP